MPTGLKKYLPLGDNFLTYLILAGLPYGYPDSFVLSKPRDCFVANYYYIHMLFIEILYIFKDLLNILLFERGRERERENEQ